MLNKGLTLTLLSMIALAACSTTKTSAPAPTAAAEKPWSGKTFLRQGDLQGKDARAVDDLLGAPALTRAEGKGEFRRYAFASCALIVILYPDDKGEARVQKLDAAAKMSGEPKPDLDQCLARGPAPVPTS